MDGGARDSRNQKTPEDRSKTNLNHPLLNKWLIAEVINKLPDETAQAVADLIEAAVRRQKKRSVNAHTTYEFKGGSRGGKGRTTSLNIERLKEALIREGEKGDNCDKQNQPDHQ